MVRSGAAPAEDRGGSRNATNGFAPTPKWRANASLSWSKGIQSASATVRFIDRYGNDQNASPTFGIPEIDSFTTVDVHYQIELDGLIDGEQTVLAVGANNVFDTDPPALSRFDGAGNHVDDGVRPGYDGEVHDIRGRIYYFQFRQSF